MLAFSTSHSARELLGQSLGNDFGVYFRTANASAEIAYKWAGYYIFPYAPTMLLWISPLSLISFWPAFVLFNLFSLALFVWATRKHLSTAAILLCLISPALTSGLLTGQVSLVITALLVLACSAEDRLKAGILFGLIASIKPQLVIMAPFVLLLLRDWRALIAAAITFLALVLLSIVIFGPERWLEWTQALDQLRSAVEGTNLSKRGVTPAIFAERMGFSSALALAIGITCGALMAYFGRKSHPIEVATLIGASSLLASPYALRYDLVVVMPYIALALSQRRFSMLLATIPWYSMPLIIVAADLIRRTASGHDGQRATDLRLA